MRRSLIFLLLLTVILSSLPPTSPRASPESGDLALVATLNGTVHLVDTKRGESRWSFSMGKPIYSSFTRNDPDFYVDVGEDWKLYFHRKGIGKMKKPSIDVGEFMRRMPHVWDDGALLLGHEKTSVFFVDAKSGGMICSHESDNSASTLGSGLPMKKSFVFMRMVRKICFM
ncbi:hypothetical protein KPL71_000090 [Citrus sinensis]|uniref:Uncharacterized protein n=1 Tax=Citrus sinensis TaxID=2711 RepID=A0ACB8NLJ1_CITSI|nr:hypothetical protein KPL71_000090 [Citrus sinensis]